MIGMSKRLRDLRALAETEGCVIDRVEVGPHVKVYVHAPGGGQSQLVVVGGSPSDRRAWLATRSSFRRIARGGRA